MKLLIIEDDVELLRSMLLYFDAFGYHLDRAKTVADAIWELDRHKYDCVVLDINLPDGSGLDILRKMKRTKIKTGILILSANDSIEDKLDGLELGADDYLTKPFHLAELNARIKSIVRRNTAEGNNEIQINELKIDISANEVYINEQQLKLTKKEFELLLFLATNRNRVVTKQTISDYIWGGYMEHTESSDMIYAHLKNLRKKISQAEGSDYIKTVHGIGYKFSTDETAR
jgi:DNA-binding response OmpR family regulator